jgi:YbbR domain-containing protein
MTLSDLTSNMSLKLFSLAVGIVSYLLVNVESSTPVDVEFRVSYELADGIMLTGDPIDTIHVALQGPWSNFRSFATEDMEPVVINLGDHGPGALKHHIDLTHVNSPGGMQVISVRPSELEITLDRKIQKDVPVQVDPVGRPAFGYEIVEIRVDPARVKVEGPLGVMRTLDFIYTRAVEIADREQDLETEVDLRAPPAPLRLDTKRVKVLVDIGEEFIERTFRNVGVALENAPKRSKVIPNNVNITLKGPRRVVDKMEKEAVAVFVDANPEADDPAVRSVEKTVQIRQQLPDRVQVVGAPAKVQLEMPRRRRRR